MKREMLRQLLAARDEKRPAILVTDLEDGRQSLIQGDEIRGDLTLRPEEAAAARTALERDRSGVLEGTRLFVRVFNPPLRLIVVGAVHIAQALAPMAVLAGYEVTVVDPRRAWATDERFPNVSLRTDWPDDAMKALRPDRRTAVVTLTHDPKLDDPALAEALGSDAFYIGALGSRKTHATRLQRLTGQGFTAAELARVHGPVGLAIGAKSPAEIALSILAQVTQALHGSPQAVGRETEA